MTRFLGRGMKLLVLTLGAIGCRAEDATVVEADGVRVEAVADELVITNGRARDIFYFLVDEAVATRIEWAPCVQPPDCPSVRAQSSARERLDGLRERSDGALLFFWWHVISRDGLPSADSIRVLRVE